MRLDDLRPAVPKHSRKRVGRGIGSGHGVTAGRGTKGQKSRGSVRPGFEGGQTPLHRRLPHARGFNNRWKKIYAVVNLDDLERFDAGAVVDPDTLCSSGLVKKIEDGVKVLGDGNLTKALTVRAHKFSKTALEKIAAVGGTAEVIG